jgi:t-SNARE complex subunit (syntaxin)
MQQFFSDVELVKKHILVIRNSTKRVAEINQQVVLATTSESEHEESQELQVLVTETNKKAAIAKQLLKKLNEETEGMKGAPGNNKQSEIRIRENLSNTLTRKFVDVMKEYQTAQTKYKTDIKKKVKRQVQIIKPDATQEEIDTVLAAGGGSGELMKAAILKVSGGARLVLLHVRNNSHNRFSLFHHSRRATPRTPFATRLKT